jgi:hypothetical protein
VERLPSNTTAGPVYKGRRTYSATWDTAWARKTRKLGCGICGPDREFCSPGRGSTTSGRRTPSEPDMPGTETRLRRRSFLSIAVGMLLLRKEPNPGHGQVQVVTAAASRFQLVAEV